MSLRKLFILFGLFAVLGGLNAQTKESLQKEKAKLQAEIVQLGNMLSQNAKSTKATQVQLTTLQNSIRTRTKVLSNINSEITLLNRQIASEQKKADALARELDTLKSNYARMCIHYYDNKSEQMRLMYILSSNSFLQAYKRRGYIREYVVWIKEQGAKIEETKSEIEKTITGLNKSKAEKTALLAEQQSQLKSLEQDKSKEQKLLSSLQKKQKDLTASLKQKQSTSAKIQQEIDKIVQAEIKKGQGYEMTPQAKQLSSDFGKNKGRLPWPVAKGMVYSRFGRQPYPGLPKVFVDNPGIEIVTEKGAKALAVFDGEVSVIQLMPGENYFVYVRHGAYITVYGNIRKVYVKKGDAVKRGQQLGEIYFDADQNMSKLNFLLYQDKLNQDPELWLTK